MHLLYVLRTEGLESANEEVLANVVDPANLIPCDFIHRNGAKCGKTSKGTRCRLHVNGLAKELCTGCGKPTKLTTKICVACCKLGVKPVLVVENQSDAV
jgi:hypothetical protein